MKLIVITPKKGDIFFQTGVRQIACSNFIKKDDIVAEFSSGRTIRIIPP
jgi:hypothetical protein